jgi:hypothetical protein
VRAVGGVARVAGRSGLRCISAISCSSSWAFCSSSRIICRTLACADTRWRLASSISFCFCRLRFLMRKARSCSCSSVETPMTSPSLVTFAPSGGAKPGGGCGCPSEPQVRRASSSVASWWAPNVGTCSPVQVDPTGECSNANRVFARDGNSSVNLASQGHCAGVFIGN